MVRKVDLRNVEITDHQIRAVQDIIELPFWRPARMGRHALVIGTDQAGCGEKQFQFPVAPEHIEIAGDNQRPLRLADQLVQPLQLMLALAKRQGQVDEKNGHVRKLHLDDQPLEPFLKIMKMMTDDLPVGEQALPCLFSTGTFWATVFDPIL